MTKRIGVLTGGGDCPGLNGVIRAVTLHARHTFGWDVIGIRHGFQGLYDEDIVLLTSQTVQGVLGRGGTILGSNNRANPFAYPLTLPDGRREVHDVSAKCIKTLNDLDLEGLVVVGGDGTMVVAQKFIDRGAKHIVGVPKTIDNDLATT
ncbi:MAG TPA: 6-phosphofructokinase, partial [Kofleriaceae bacterium]|nr:6-phosphofructokinase [Kofleriaceae bacterium]